MKRVQAAVGCKMEWVAAQHINTENPHVRVAMRGVDENGAGYRMNRTLVRQGIRQFRHGELHQASGSPAGSSAGD
jgi:type IV secretory pathway VirD2 relaxase